ncbi:MAG: hypothetical protein ACFB21_03965 [Opitutales bacterium]
MLATDPLKSLKDPRELMTLPRDATPYEFPQMMRVEKFFERQFARKKLKQLRVFDPVIRSMLRPGERVFYLTQGVRNNFLEQQFFGWAAYYFSRSAFVFTDQRVLILHLLAERKLGHFVGEIHYDDIARLKPTFFGGLLLKFRTKKQIVFAHVPARDRKFIKEFLLPMIEGNEALGQGGQEIRHLCPACYSPCADATASACSACGCKFKTPKAAAMRSLILPGMGDYYLGSSLGLLEMTVVGAMWAYFVAMLLMIYSPAVPNEEGLVAEEAITFGAILLVGHLMDALKTYYMAKKGVFSKRNIKKIRAEQNREGWRPETSTSAPATAEPPANTPSTGAAV